MKKTNILQFICSTGFYGAERWVLALANNLNHERFRCDLAVTMEPEQKKLDITQQFPGITYEIPMKSRLDISVVGRLATIIKEKKIDIIHTHGYKSDILGLLAAKKTGIKCIATPHGFDGSGSLKLKLFGEAGDFSLRFFNQVSPLSEKLTTHVLKKGVPKNKVTLIKNGVDLKEVDKQLNKQKQINSQSIKKVGFIGQMIPRKNIKHILDIYNRLWIKHKNIELILLGDGELREELESYASTLPSSSNIKFLGFRNDRLELLHNFDLFVMTSSYEGIPRCLMEAMAMKIPVAAYNIPGIDKLVSHEKTGLLAPLDDQNKLTEYWEKLLFDQEYANKISAEGRSFVLENFSAARMAKEYEELFKSVLS